jgi:CheY-like chemotaxis protein
MSGREVANVLVVDDEPEVRELLVDALQSADVKVSTAASGREAIDLGVRRPPDMLIMDLRLGDCSGLEVIDRLREVSRDLPAVVITGHGDARSLTEASRRRPIELMAKPLDIERLQNTVREGLTHGDRCERLRRRTRRLRRIARGIKRDSRSIQGQLETTCADLTSAYRTLSGQMSLHQSIIGYQNAMIAARNDDDVFASLFRLFSIRSGPVFGVAMVCDEEARLNIIGRFGVPRPDPLAFCEKLSWPVVRLVLDTPRSMLFDAGEEADMFDESIRSRLPGVTVLAVPLTPAANELIGLAVLYRKGEQPFTDADVALAEMVSYPTATAVRRND